MGNRVRIGNLRTAHTVTAVSSINGVFSVSNPERILKGSTYTTNSDNSNISNLYAQVTSKSYTTGGTTYNISLNWGISNPSVNSTVYFDQKAFGVQVSKKNTDVNTVGTRNMLFDSRIRRRGVLYGGGFQSSLSSALNFTTGKAALGYIPLILTSEDKQGEVGDFQGGSYSTEGHYMDNRSFFEFTATTIQPKSMIDGLSGSVPGPGDVISSRTSYTGNACTNLDFKVLRIPCAYGYMTSAYFAHPETTDTSEGSLPGTSTRLPNGNKRAIIGKLTNSNLSSGTLRGMSVSRPGKDITTCDKDDIILGTDTGVIADSYRGDRQALATNYSAVVSSSAIPVATAVATVNAAVSQTASFSIFNPYTATASSSYRQTTGTGSASSTAQDFTYAFNNSTNTLSLTTANTSGQSVLQISAEPRLTTLGLF